MIELIMMQAVPAAEYRAEATALARMAMAVGMCSQMGYEASIDAGRDAVEAFAGRALRDPAAPPDAIEIYEAAMAAAGAEVSRLSEAAPDESPEQEDGRMRSLADLFVARCQESARTYPTVVVADGDEPATGAEFIARLQAEAETVE